MNAKEIAFILLLIAVSPVILVAIIVRFSVSGFQLGWSLGEEVLTWIFD